MYNSHNVKQLFSVLPKVIKEEAYDKFDVDSSNEEVIKALRMAMVNLRKNAQQRMWMKIDASVNLTVSFDNENRRNEGNPRCFMCTQDVSDQTHITEWSIFGCLSLLRLNPKERIKELRSRNICYNCGEKRVTETCQDQKDHKCIKIYKEIECYEENCNWNGFTCRHEQVDPGVRRKVLDKLGLSLPDVIQAQVEDVLDEPMAQSSQSSQSIQHRINDLQSGAVSKQMSDHEIKDWFQMREKRDGGDISQIMRIPEGETMFMFCVVKGKTRGLTAFLDNGCSGWLVKDGVPEKELKSVKLRDGPIPMGVAGGHTVDATAEWASLIPLADGRKQIVRGLSTRRVTGNWGDIDMKEIMDEIKEASSNTNEETRRAVSNLKAPKMISGEVDMLIGIKYLSIFPEPVYSTPEGLTLYKSKFLPQINDEVACVGGPSKAFSNLVNCAGFANVIRIFTNIVSNPGYPSSRRLEYFPSKHCGETEQSKMLLDIEEENLKTNYLGDNTLKRKNKHLQSTIFRHSDKVKGHNSRKECESTGGKFPETIRLEMKDKTQLRKINKTSKEVSKTQSWNLKNIDSQSVVKGSCQIRCKKSAFKFSNTMCYVDWDTKQQLVATKKNESIQKLSCKDVFIKVTHPFGKERIHEEYSYKNEKQAKQ